MTPPKILVVNNEQPIRRLFCNELNKSGFVTIEAATLNLALKVFEIHSPIITFLDVNFPDGSGWDALREIKKQQPEAIVIVCVDEMLTDEIILAFRAGADDVITKPVDLEELHDLVGKAMESREALPRVHSFQRDPVGSFSFEQIIGQSPAIKETISLARKVADSEVSCMLLQGESGTGKDLIAKAIHYSSPRADKPFVAINCAAIPANLLESELFGFEKGAFTDAKVRKEGLFEQAEGGTLYLDEIGELDIGLQAKLLRVLEEGNFRRVGGLHDLPLNIRVIAASNRNLKVESEEQRFRQDLYYRLSIVQIELPPLRQRGDDVILLAEHFIKRLDKKWQQPLVRKLTAEVAQAFRRYRWSGNVRELRNVIERALIFEENELITMKYMPLEFPVNGNSKTHQLRGDLLKASLYFTMPPDGISLDVVEEWLIQEALKRSGGNVSRASKILRVSRDRIRYWLKKQKSQKTLNQ